jgi:hypothetical protein
VHDPDVALAAFALADIGCPRGRIAAELQLSRSTVNAWLTDGWRTRRAAPRPIPPSAYAYLLGLYLGDGHVVELPRSHRLDIACDGAYPGIIESARRAIRAVSGDRSVREIPVKGSRCVRVSATWRCWPTVLPQHGPGRKHTRPIVLAGWQRDICDAHPEALIRGLIESDGSRFLARQRVGDRVYPYVRYSFSNRSEDIRSIFCAHLDRLGIRWTTPSPHSVAIDRRPEVAKLDRFIGPKR